MMGLHTKWGLSNQETETTVCDVCLPGISFRPHAHSCYYIQNENIPVKSYIHVRDLILTSASYLSAISFHMSLNPKADEVGEGNKSSPVQNADKVIAEKVRRCLYM